jgi:predicted metal-binding membrane protein
MESATLRAGRSSAPALQVALIGSLLVVAAVAWVLTRDRMSGMDPSPGAGLGGFGWFAVSWIVMMAAMMLPALVPAALAVARHAPRSVAGFVLGYLIAWAGAGVAAYVVVTSVRALDVSFLGWDRGGRYAAAAVILVAAAYQLTAAKSRCLSRCRAARAGSAAARASVRAGLLHGASCIGCCAGLMAVLFALGVMSLTWMVAVAVLIAAERLLPWPKLAVYTVAAVLVVMGVWIAVGPANLPGLTPPGTMNGM